MAFATCRRIPHKGGVIHDSDWRHVMRRNGGVRLGLTVAACALAGVWGCSSRGRDPNTSAREAALTTCSTIVAEADTMVSNPPIDQSFGTMPILRAGGGDEALVIFDLGTIPSSAAVSSATLRLYISGSGSSAPVNAHAVTAPWTE